MKRKISIGYLVLLMFTLIAQLYAEDVDAKNEIKVGVILDLGSWIGKSIYSCMKIAISDFYASNSKSQYRTRIVLHTRDSKGDPAVTISAAVDLLENVKVQTIIGPETYLEANLLAVLGNKAKIPIFSFSSIFPSSDNSSKYPFHVQIKQDETIQSKGIAAIHNNYHWRSINVIYEDIDDGRNILSYLADSFVEAKIHIAYTAAISPSSSDDQIIEDLQKLMSMKATIFVVHISPSLASRLFLIAKTLGMMKQGYAWIITDKTLKFLHTLDHEVIESLQGVLGFKAHVPSSRQLRNLTLRWRKEFYGSDPTIDPRKLNQLDVQGIWAYDTIRALAESFEKIWVEFWKREGNRNSTTSLSSSQNSTFVPDHGTRLLDELRRTKFKGVSGKFGIRNGRLDAESYVVMNVIGEGERRIGYWTQEGGLSKVKLLVNESFGNSSSTRKGLKAAIWPGGATNAPKGQRLLTNGQKLQIAIPFNFRSKEFVNTYFDPLKKSSVFSGFCVEVFEAAIKSLDYEVEYEFVMFEGSYTDLLRLIHREKFYGAIGGITISAHRSFYVDFTLPYTDLGIGTITGRHKIHDIWFFLKPLHLNLWITSACFFVLMGIVVWAIEHPTNEEFQGSVPHQMGTILSFGFSTLVYAHRERLTSNLSRLAVIVWLFVVLILTSSYTATLSSMLTVNQIQLASTGQYIGTQSKSFKGVIMNKLNFEGNQIRVYKSLKEYADALSRGSKNGGVTSIVDEIPYIKLFLGKYGTHYSMVASASTTNGFGFAFQKGSPLVPDMSRAIAQLREEGELERIEKKWFNDDQLPYFSENTSSMPSILNLESFGGLFLISCISFILALLLHVILNCLKRLQAKNTTTITLLRGGKFSFMLRFFVPRKQISAVELTM